MKRNYLALALLSVVAYSLVAPLLKIAMATIPSTTAVFLSNGLMVVLLGVLMAYRGTSPWEYLTHPKAPYILVWGTFLAVGLLAYYRALELGPVSVVVPIFGLFIAVSSVIGIVAFEESVTVRKGLGIGFAVLAVVFMSL